MISTHTQNDYSQRKNDIEAAQRPQAVSRIFSYLAAAFFCLSAQSCFATDEIDSQLQIQFEKQIKPLLLENCGDCHCGVDANAGLNFDSFQSVEQVLDANRIWEKVKSEVENDRMPPADSNSLSLQQKSKLLEWIARTSNILDCANAYPGNVTIRKLNRIEYRNSVRDLLGVDYLPANDFPGDDVGDGFDNIADVLSLPPLLMEKYLDAAETIAAAAIIDPDLVAVDIDLNGASFSPDDAMVKRHDGMLVFLSEHTAHKRIQFPLPGEYVMTVQAYGDQAGNEPVKMSVLIDGQTVKSFDVKSRRRKPSRHRFKLSLTESGDKNLQLKFDNDYYRPRAVGNQDRNLYVVGISIKGPKPAKPPVAPEFDYLNFEYRNIESAEKFVGSFLPRIFRGPVDSKQQARFLDLFRQSLNQGQSFHGAIRTIVQAALVSPRFLYKLEQPIDENDGNSIRTLDDFERATALSYFVWSSTPDDTLLALANDRRLSNRVIWQQQIERLLHDKRAEALVDNFATQWLNLRLLANVQPDTAQFPNINQQLLSDMETETRMVVADIFRRNRSIVELLDCNYSYINERLAAHYQIDGIQGNHFRRVNSINDHRAGVLTHASILTLTSNPTRTSPVKRGKWVMENVLGEEPPPAPANVAPLDDQSELTGSLRQRMQQHRSDPACAACHTSMDAFGFALENFDAIGRFRIKDGPFEIDATSELSDGTTISGIRGLQDYLQITSKEKFIRCFTEKLLTFALGRGLKYYDRCAVDKIIEQASENDYHFSDIVIAIAQSDPFLKRGGRKSD